MVKNNASDIIVTIVFFLCIVGMCVWLYFVVTSSSAGPLPLPPPSPPSPPPPPPPPSETTSEKTMPQPPLPPTTTTSVEKETKKTITTPEEKTTSTYTMQPSRTTSTTGTSTGGGGGSNRFVEAINKAFGLSLGSNTAQDACVTRHAILEPTIAQAHNEFRKDRCGGGVGAVWAGTPDPTTAARLWLNSPPHASIIRGAKSLACGAGPTSAVCIAYR
jgi:hypothetical protein